MTTLEKQLIVMMFHGLWVERCDGHRWLRDISEEEDGETYTTYNFQEDLKKHKIKLRRKYYGGVKQTVLAVDECFRMMYSYSLEEYYDTEISDEDDVQVVGFGINYLPEIIKD